MTSDERPSVPPAVKVLDGVVAGACAAAVALFVFGPFRTVAGETAISIRWTHLLFVRSGPRHRPACRTSVPEHHRDVALVVFGSVGSPRARRRVAGILADAADRPPDWLSRRRDIRAGCRRTCFEPANDPPGTAVTLRRELVRRYCRRGVRMAGAIGSPAELCVFPRVPDDDEGGWCGNRGLRGRNLQGSTHHALHMGRAAGRVVLVCRCRLVLLIDCARFPATRASAHGRGPHRRLSFCAVLQRRVHGVALPARDPRCMVALPATRACESRPVWARRRT